jgi:hypothetical protein
VDEFSRSEGAALADPGLNDVLAVARRVPVVLEGAASGQLEASSIGDESAVGVSGQDDCDAEAGAVSGDIGGLHGEGVLLVVAAIADVDTKRNALEPLGETGGDLSGWGRADGDSGGEEREDGGELHFDSRNCLKLEA